MRACPSFGPLLAMTVAACADDPPPVVPSAALVATPSEGTSGRIFRLDASASLSEGSRTGLLFRFDPMGDGVFSSFSTEPTFEARIERVGQVTSSVEVKNADAQTARASVVISVRENRAPTAQLALTPLAGPPPLFVTADLTGSVDPDDPTTPLVARLDFDGDGTTDQSGASDKKMAFTYESEGEYELRAEVEDVSGAVARRTLVVKVGYFVDLDVDANRDGVIDEADDPIEETFGPQAGAVFVTNLDDDDQDGRADLSDSTTDGTDAADLMPIVVRRVPNALASTVDLTVSPANVVRIFRRTPGGSLIEALAPTSTTLTIPASDLAEDAALFLEGVKLRSSSWDGRVRLTLTQRAGADSASDSVEVRSSPIIFPSNLEAAERLYVMPIVGDITENSAALDVIRRNLPSGVELYEVDADMYGWDRWVQDNMQTGYQSHSSALGPRFVQSYLNTVRGTGDGDLRGFVPDALTGPGLGYVDPGGMESSHNYGGNIEVSAPYDSWPYGRLIVGGGSGGTINGVPYSDSMTRQERVFLDAQMQGPALEVSSEWLMVGHIDEIFQLVPAPSVAGQKKWKFVFSSPELALEDMARLEGSGRGGSSVFQALQLPRYNRFGEITGWISAQQSVSELLADTELVAYNRAVQARIDSVRETIAREMNLTADDVVEVPVLYEIDGYQGSADLSAAKNPGVQNLVTVNHSLFVPNPVGPIEGGNDSWQRLTRAALEPLGLEVFFVDVWYSYHILIGEIHCGTEIQHAPFSAPWWEVEQ